MRARALTAAQITFEQFLEEHRESNALPLLYSQQMLSLGTV
jgi:hypothetical protein